VNLCFNNNTICCKCSFCSWTLIQFSNKIVPKFCFQFNFFNIKIFKFYRPKSKFIDLSGYYIMIIIKSSLTLNIICIIMIVWVVTSIYYIIFDGIKRKLYFESNDRCPPFSKRFLHANKIIFIHPYTHTERETLDKRIMRTNL